MTLIIPKQESCSKLSLFKKCEWRLKAQTGQSGNTFVFMCILVLFYGKINSQYFLFLSPYPYSVPRCLLCMWKFDTAGVRLNVETPFVEYSTLSVPEILLLTTREVGS